MATQETGLTAERIKAFATLGVTLLALANSGLTLAGINVLPFTDDQVSAAISGTLGVIGTVYAWWKNQNVTKAAVEGNKLVKALKSDSTTQGTEAQTQKVAEVADSSDTVELESKGFDDVTADELAAPVETA